MPFGDIIQVVGYLIIGLGSWILKTLWSAVSSLRADLIELTKDISVLRENIAKDYMPRDEIRDLFDNILREIRESREDLRKHEEREYNWHQATIEKLSNKVDK